MDVPRTTSILHLNHLRSGRGGVIHVNTTPLFLIEIFVWLQCKVDRPGTNKTLGSIFVVQLFEKKIKHVSQGALPVPDPDTRQFDEFFFHNSRLLEIFKFLLVAMQSYQTRYHSTSSIICSTF